MLAKRCDRCKNLMLEEQIMLAREASAPKFLSADHCISCGRDEYGTSESDDSASAAASAHSGPPTASFPSRS